MGVRIVKDDEDKAVELDYLQKGGVVIVCDSDDDWRQLLQTAATRYHEWMNDNTDIFDVVMVNAMIQADLDNGGTERDLLRLRGVDLAEHTNSFVELDPLDPAEFNHTFESITSKMTEDEKQASGLVTAYITRLAEWEDFDEQDEPALSLKELARECKISVYEAQLATEAALDEVDGKFAVALRKALNE